MATAALTLYTLIWPVVVAVVMVVIGTAFFREWRSARRNGVDII